MDGKVPVVKLFEIFGKEIEKLSIVLDDFCGVWGNISMEELCKVCLIVKHLQPKRVLEIGTFNGLTTYQIHINSPGSIIYTIDLFEMFEDRNVQYDNNFYSHTRGLQFEIGEKFKGKTDKIIQCFGDSTKFNFDPYKNFDLIFIDGGHDYDTIKIDSENAFKLINKNGVILWHNFKDKAYQGITKYLLEVQGKQIYHLKNTLLAVYLNT